MSKQPVMVIEALANYTVKLIVNIMYHFSRKYISISLDLNIIFGLFYIRKVKEPKYYLRPVLCILIHITLYTQEKRILNQIFW